MKYLIPQERLNNLIYRTIDKIIDKNDVVTTSDYEFRNDAVVTKTTYHLDNSGYPFKEYFSIYFENYFRKSGKLRDTTPLLVADDDNVTNILTDLFDDKWYPVFVQWVEDNFNQKIKSFMEPRLNEPIFMNN